MARAAHKGAISVALLHIPIALYTTTQEVDIKFNQLCPDGSRIQYKKVCAGCGSEITDADIQRGFQISADQYVIITDEDIEAVKTPEDRTLQILHTCDQDAVPRIYYEKNYHTLPEPGGDRAYELLRVTLLTAGKIAIGKTVMGNSEVLFALVPTEEELMVQTLYFENEVKGMPKAARQPELRPEELKLAEQIILNLDKEFVPSDHKNEFQAKLRDMVEAKAAGKEIVATPDVPQDNIIDLMTALTESAQQTGGAKKAKKKPAAPRKKASEDKPKSPAV